MRERVAGSDVPPDHLITFDGREFATAAEWTEAYELWYDARDQWEADHPGVVLPEKRVLSSCPFDGMDMIGVPHSGAWSRVQVNGEDVTRCGAHNLAPDEH
jgi:hypothetical protein